MFFPHFWHSFSENKTTTKNKSTVNNVGVNLTFSSCLISIKAELIFLNIKISELFMDFLNTI